MGIEPEDYRLDQPGKSHPVGCSLGPHFPSDVGLNRSSQGLSLQGLRSPLHFCDLADVPFTPCIQHHNANPVPPPTAGSSINPFCFSKRFPTTCFLNVILPGITAFILFFSILALLRGPRLCSKVFSLIYFISLLGVASVLEHRTHSGNFIGRTPRPHFSTASGTSRCLVCI